MARKKTGAQTSKRWRKILTAFTLSAFLLLIYLLRDQIFETLSNLNNVNVYILLFVVVWQALNYHSYARLYQQLFEILGLRIRYKSLYKAAIELNFVNHVFPSGGVSGFSYFGFRMRHFGATAAQATLVQTMRFVTVFISFQVLLLIGVLMLSFSGQASNFTIFVATALGTLLIVSTAIAIYVIGDRKRIDSFFTGLTRALNWVIKSILPKRPETIKITNARRLFLEFHENYEVLRKNYTKLKKPLVYAFFASFTEIATLYTVYVAFGEYINFGAIIIAYAVANFAGLLSVLPGGIGVYEGLMTAVLATVGVPAKLSIPVTVMYRVLTMALQLPLGYFLYQRAINKDEDAFDKDEEKFRR